MFFENFSNLCAKVGKSPSAVVTEIGLNKSAVTSWKKGTNPTNATILKLSNYFGVSVEVLTGPKQKRAVSDSDTAQNRQAAAQEDSGLPEEFARLFMSLSPENQNAVIAEMLKRQRTQGYPADQVPGER